MKKIILLILCVLLIAPNCMAQEEYIETRNLSDKYLSDKFQKNYTTGDNTISKLQKSAEWTDKEMLEGKITIKETYDIDSTAETTAVYAFIPCTAHGFSANLTRENIAYMLKNYDHVDIISVYSKNTDGITIYKDVKEEDISTIVRDSKFKSDQHFSSTIYAGLYKYLFGSFDSTTQIEDPTTIYVSLDLVVSYANDITLYEESTGIINYSYDCWDLLKRYQQEGRYYSMTDFKFPNSEYYMEQVNNGRLDGYNFTINRATGSNFDNGIVFSEKYRRVINTIIGLADPSAYPGIDADYCVLDNVAPLYISVASSNRFFAVFKGDFKRGDFSYTESLETQKPFSLTIKDKVKEQFEITSYQCNVEQAIINVENNNVTATIENYEIGKEVVLEINIRLKEEYKKEFLKSPDKWQDTNEGSVISKLTLSGNELITNESVSPKLSIQNPSNKTNPETFTNLKYLLGFFILLCPVSILFIMSHRKKQTNE